MKISNIRNLKIFKKSNLKAKLCALSLAGVIGMTGCTSLKTGNDLDEYNKEVTNSYLDKNLAEIYEVESLANGERRGILLSNEPHPYEALLEETDTKVYLSDENGDRLTKNFDKLCLLSDFRYLSFGGMLGGDWTNVETDKEYDCFVGTTLQNEASQSVTLLDKDGEELCSFDGYFKAMQDNVVVVQDYFDKETSVIGAPDTYLYDYTTGEKSEMHDYVEMFKYKNEQDKEISHLIGVNFYSVEDSFCSKNLYTFYDDGLKVVDVVNEDELEEWYMNNGDEKYDSFKKYESYFKNVYENNKSMILLKHLKTRN